MFKSHSAIRWSNTKYQYGHFKTRTLGGVGLFHYEIRAPQSLGPKFESFTVYFPTFSQTTEDMLNFKIKY